MCRILVVNDNDNIIDFLSQNLKSLSNNVDFVKNIGAAWQHIDKNKIDLIIIGVVINEDNGIDFCKKLRVSNNILQPFLIFLSAIMDDKVEISAFDAGADDYINYPINNELFIRKIGILIKRIDQNKMKFSA